MVNQGPTQCTISAPTVGMQSDGNGGCVQKRTDRFADRLGEKPPFICVWRMRSGNAAIIAPNRAHTFLAKCTFGATP
jgi:hypothetical protein